jgi:hypothetical protein
MADTNAAVRGNRAAPADGRDPGVKLPPRVRAEAERAEALLKQSIGEDPNSPVPVTTIEDAPPATEDRVVIPPIQTQQPQPMVQQPTNPPAQPPQGKTYSENDFKAMQTRFERADQQAQRLSEEVSNLRNVIATMQTAPAPVPTAATPPELQAQSLLTPQEISDYGPEFLEVVGKKAREIAGTEIAQLRAQVESLSRGMQATTQMTSAQARDKMLDILNEKIPTWRDINNDPNFLAWLRLPDAFSGAIRHDLLKAAYDQNNAARVSAFFQGFLAEEAAVEPANPAPPARPGAAPARVPLETLAAPGRAKSAAASAPAEKPIITRAQVAAFYADVAAGKYRGREQEKNQAEAEIFLATNEGRLR